MSTEIEIYETFRDYIKHEDQLINYRMTWMLTIHGFLYATYGFTIQKLLEVTEKSANTLASNVCSASFIENYTQNSSLAGIIFEARAFLYCICAVGIGISASAFLSIRSAYKAVDAIREIFDRFKVSEDLEVLRPGVSRLRVYSMGSPICPNVRLPLITGGGRPWGSEIGFIVAWLIPSVLFGSWIISIAFLLNSNNITNNIKVDKCPNYIRKTIFVPEIEYYFSSKRLPDFWLRQKDSSARGE